MTDEFFRARLEQMVDLKHPLAVLASRLPWTQIEAALAPPSSTLFSSEKHGLDVQARRNNGLLSRQQA